MAEYVPAGHGTHVFEDVAPKDLLYEPSGHLVQSSDDEDPISVQYVPVEQEIQLSAPGVSVYFPVGQS